MGSLYIGDTEVISGGGGGGGGYCIFCTCSVPGNWSAQHTFPAETRYIQNVNSSFYYTPVSLAGVDGNSRELSCACGSNMSGKICKLSEGTYSFCTGKAQTFYLIC